MTNYDPIPDIVRLGYTAREAAFLYLVGRSSGFFLGRQYCHFIRRKPGALIQQLIEKGIGYGHIELLDYGQRRHVYHLKSRTVYRLLGDEESQNRRTKGDEEVKTKLMILDYVLEHFGQPFLASPREKAAFLIENYGVSPQSSRQITDRFPLFTGPHNIGDGWVLQFCYFDHGTCTGKAFARYLTNLKPVLDSLDRFQINYVALSQQNFHQAEHDFDGSYPDNEDPTELLPMGLEHLLRFFEAEHRWATNNAAFSQADLQTLKEGERLYLQDTHARLRGAWQSGVSAFEAELARVSGGRNSSGRLVFHVLREIYPIFGYRYKGKRAKSTPESQIGSFSSPDSIAS